MQGIPSLRHTHLTPEAPGIRGLLLSYRARSLLAALLDLIYPPCCSGCGRVDTRWCRRCQADLDALPLSRLIRDVPGLQATAATALHDGVIQKAIHGLKYEGVPELARPLGARLAAELPALGWPIDLVVPVPLFPSHEKARGYNQSALLAEELARRAQLPFAANALIRHRDTRSQVGLSGTERRTNVAGAFRADPTLVRGRHVLIIDDVHTTGATLAACAESALTAGAQAVYALTLTAAR